PAQGPRINSARTAKDLPRRDVDGVAADGLIVRVSAEARAHRESITRLHRKRAPVAELESSADPQPGKAALRGARFPACGFWRLSSRQIATLSSNPRASRAWKGAVTPVSSAQNGGKTHISEVVRTHRSSRAVLGRCGAAL